MAELADDKDSDQVLQKIAAFFDSVRDQIVFNTVLPKHAFTKMVKWQ